MWKCPESGEYQPDDFGKPIIARTSNTVTGTPGRLQTG